MKFRAHTEHGCEYAHEDEDWKAADGNWAMYQQLLDDRKQEMKGAFARKNKMVEERGALKTAGFFPSLSRSAITY